MLGSEDELRGQRVVFFLERYDLRDLSSDQMEKWQSWLDRLWMNLGRIHQFRDEMNDRQGYVVFWYEGLAEDLKFFFQREVEMSKIKLDLKDAIDIPTVVTNGPLIGYRTWALRPGCLLGSVTADYVWEGPIVRNNKNPVIFESGVRGRVDQNYIGFYFAKDPNQLVTRWSVDYNMFYGRGHVAGICSLFGRVMEHTNGYRARYARVEHLALPRWKHGHKIISANWRWVTGPGDSIWIPPPTEKVADLLREHYQCHVEIVRDADHAISYLNYMKKELEQVP